MPWIGRRIQLLTMARHNSGLHIHRALTNSLTERGIDVEIRKSHPSPVIFREFRMVGSNVDCKRWFFARHSLFQCRRSTLKGDEILLAVQATNEHGNCCAPTTCQSTRVTFAAIMHSLKAPLTILLLHSHVRNKDAPVFK